MEELTLWTIKQQDITVAMTAQEARECIDEINNCLQSARELIYKLWSREGWRSLGYSNWTECVEGEFETSARHVWRELSAAKIEGNLLTNWSVGTIPESQLRPLTSLDPDQQREAWQRATDTAPEGKITAAHVQSVVNDIEFNRQQILEANRAGFCIEVSPEITRAKQAMAITTYSHQSLEYYTPTWVLDAARRVIGEFDLDPASCKEAQENVKAQIYYTQENDGLSQSWFGKVWLNPPYSKTNGRSNQDIWSERLLQEYEIGNVSEAILLVKAALGYKWFEELFDRLPVCFIRERLSFVMEDGNDEGQSKQGTAIFYIGNNFDLFYKVFKEYGRVIPPTNHLDTLLK